MFGNTSSNAVVVNLASGNKISPILVQNWIEQTGWDPIELARDRAADERWYNRLCIATFALFALALICFLAGWIVSQKYVNYFSDVMNDCSVGLFVAGVISGVLMIFQPCFPGEQVPFARKVDSITAGLFGDHLNKFSEWGGTTIEEIRDMDTVTLDQVAERILVTKAEQILVLQDENKDVPLAMWASRKKVLTDELKYRSSVLRLLGLFNGPYGPVFEKARAALAPTSKATQQ